jgi:hypothetical protein
MKYIWLRITINFPIDAFQVLQLKLLRMVGGLRVRGKVKCLLFPMIFYKIDEKDGLIKSLIGTL